MYTPNSFKESRTDKLHTLIRRNNFGMLISGEEGRIEATHLPFMIDPGRGKHGTLITHMARANKHWRNMRDHTETLTIFQGPHGYISPLWYENKESVPTWNYAAVHVYGQPSVIHNTDQLRKIVTDLVHFHEPPEESEWNMNMVTPKMDAMLKAIVGIEIPINRMEGKMKFNQNRSEEDQRGVIEHLSTSDDPIKQEVAKIMKNQLDCPIK
ncbi:MAG: FMN-binding negative transcriptional regulator [Balneolaceae bacterium]|nr:FMN-binding negative transcriptional regulator [Balneolaceae bacterium]